VGGQRYRANRNRVALSYLPEPDRRASAPEIQRLSPDARWFVDPFGYARSMRSLDPPDTKRRGNDYVKILQEQGFDAIQGIGGFLNLAVGGSFEALYRTAVFAPPLPDVPRRGGVSPLTR
jgi:hypothetical protein